MANILLAHKADLSQKDDEGKTALHWPVEKSDDLVAPLINAGASVNSADNQGMTPLLVAANGRDLEEMGILLQHHADICARNKRGQGVLDLAGSKKTKALLLEAGAEKCTD